MDTSPDQLVYDVLPAQNGYLALNDDVTSPIVTFTQAHINDGNVVFVHSGEFYENGHKTVIYLIFIWKMIVLIINLVVFNREGFIRVIIGFGFDSVQMERMNLICKKTHVFGLIL